MGARVVSFHYTLKNSQGEILDSSKGNQPMTYLEGSGQIIPGLEKEMRDLKQGDTKNITVVAADAYGEYDKSLVVQVPRSQLPSEHQVQVGDQFMAGAPNGPGAVFTTLEVTDTHVTLDGNHPLAGQNLNFDVHVTDIREATEEELSHGHVHGQGGHDHGEEEHDA